MQTTSLKNKSKRVQKKLYLGDYAILGFEVSAKFTQEDETDVESFFDSFIEFTESLNLCLGVGYSMSEFNGFITTTERYKSPSEDDRVAVEDGFHLNLIYLILRLVVWLMQIIFSNNIFIVGGLFINWHVKFIDKDFDLKYYPNDGRTD